MLHSPNKGHEDSAHEGKGIDVFFLCRLRFSFLYLRCSWALVSMLIVKGTAPRNKSQEAILPESGVCIEGELFVSDEGTCWMPTLHKSKEVG